ncbi:MAG: large subunit ribosomal protein L29 [Candidatus Promineifilaceae bacterium]|jgi:large subunit ribosomal protein L29|nr:50S ribosomal protein L29 [Kiritimatiellia bacterium]
MKSAQLREQTEEELQEACRSTHHAMLNFKAQKGIGEAVDHPLKIRALRRDLARIKTIMKERGIRENV